MKGSYFSGPAADEAILQVEFARQLSDTPEFADRQGDRPPLCGAPGLAAEPADKNSTARRHASGFSIVPHEEKLRIIGIVETDPALGFGGLGNGRVLIPLQLAEKLRATQATDLRQLLRDAPTKPHL